MTLFSNYMDLVHPYEEPVPPPPFCAFKYYYSRFEAVRDACSLFPDAVEYFGAFEFDNPPIARRIASTPEDFERKVTLYLLLLSSSFTFFHLEDTKC